VAHLDLTRDQFTSLYRPPRMRAGVRKPTPDTVGAAALARRINGIQGLNSDVVVLSSAVAAEGFDARFSALWRRYEYRLADSTVTKNPLLRNHVLQYPAVLDVEKMDAAANALVGLHDWIAYCKPKEFASTIRELQDFRWERVEHGVLLASVKADAFCHSMVRSLVGACVAVGAGILTVDDLIRLRDDVERTSEFKVMPAKGLTLVQVGYPEEAELAMRAVQTRRHRDKSIERVIANRVENRPQ
jgi:tRNA pseudouridine38-40 synthase